MAPAPSATGHTPCHSLLCPVLTVALSSRPGPWPRDSAGSKQVCHQGPQTRPEGRAHPDVPRPTSAFVAQERPQAPAVNDQVPQAQAIREHKAPNPESDTKPLLGPEMWRLVTRSKHGEQAEPWQGQHAPEQRPPRTTWHLLPALPRRPSACPTQEPLPHGQRRREDLLPRAPGRGWGGTRPCTACPGSNWVWREYPLGLWRHLPTELNPRSPQDLHMLPTLPGLAHGDLSSSPRTSEEAGGTSPQTRAECVAGLCQRVGSRENRVCRPSRAHTHARVHSHVLL